MATDEPPEHTANAFNPIATIDAVAPIGWRSKIARAMAQLIVGSEKGAIIYGQMRERMDTIEGRTKVSQALADEVALQAIRDPEMVERAKARFLVNAIQQHENLEAVIDGALGQLQLLPAPAIDEVATPNDDSPTIGGNESCEETDHETVDTDKPLNPDWAATFTGIAENATTQELRNRLSRILAGELTSPGTYSRATVRAVAELDRHDLEAVQAVLPFVLDNYLVRTREPIVLPRIDALLPLADAGLVSDANPLLSRTWETAPPEGSILILGGIEWGLAIEMIGGQTLEIPIVPLTRTGVAVLNLLGRHDEREILRRIASELPKSWYKMIRLGRKCGPLTLQAPFEHLFPEINIVTILPSGGATPFDPVVL